MPNEFCSCLAKNALASEGPDGDHTAISSICLHNTLLIIKYDSFNAKKLYFKFNNILQNKLTE